MKMIDRELNSDKALFGTDAPWNDPAVVIGSVLFLDVSNEKKWFGDNFLRLYTRAQETYRGPYSYEP